MQMGPEASWGISNPWGCSPLRLESDSALPHPVKEVQGCLGEAQVLILGQLVLYSLSYIFMKIFISYNCVHICYLR